jgi:hypothetical protein
MNWKPIETAPKDSSSKKMFVVIAFNAKIRSDYHYDSDPYCVWRGFRGEFVRWPHVFEPTHWVPLPEDKP